MKKALFIILLLISRFGYAQTKPHQFTFSLQVSDSINRTLVDANLLYHDNYAPMLDFQGKTIPVTLSGNQFTATIVAKDSLGYLSFRGADIPTIYSDVLLIKTSDSVCLHINSLDDIYFTGRGSSLLNYQIWLGKLMRNDTKRFFNWTSQNISYYKDLKNKRFSLAKDSLNAHQKEWGDKLYNLLRLYTSCSLNINYISRIRPLFITQCDSSYRSLVKNELAPLTEQQIYFPLTDSFMINNSFLYITYLYNLIKTHAEVLSGSDFPLFKYFYQEICNNYIGQIRDKLLAYSFLSQARRSDVFDYLPEAIRIANDTTSKKTLQKMGAKLPGADVYKFSFETLGGGVITSEDLKGKVVILDTWFNGCPGCISLAKQLVPIIKKYKNERNVVFLSVNVDKDKKRFVDGVKSKMYGAKGVTFAFTNGLGYVHPMLVYYDYASFPNVLIIGRDGKVVSSNPPRGYDEKTREKWIHLIDSAINK